MATITLNPGETIQAAINRAAAGDIIVVPSGVYNENIRIDKSVTLQGPNQGIAPTAPDINVNNGINVNEGYRTNEEAWIKGTITVAANDVTIDGFRLRNEGGPLKWEETPDNFKLLNNYVTGYSANNAPTFGDTYPIDNPTDVFVTGWELSGNYIGGLTSGVGGSMNLAGLTESSIDNNTFWRPRAAHLYLASLTNVTIEDNNFYHGLHTNDFNEDGLDQYFSGAGYGYYGRNYWLELKGINDTVNILNNTGEFNSGGIQLYSEPNQASPFVFNKITIEGNTFPSSNFINPFETAPDDPTKPWFGKSGLIPAVMATAAVGGASGSNLVIRNNTVSLDLSQVKYDTDHFSSLEVRGDFNGVTVQGNTITPTGTNTSDDVDLITGLNLYGRLPGQVLVQNNTFDGSDGNPQNDYYGIDFKPTFKYDNYDYGIFTGTLAITSNTISNWKDGAFLHLLNPGPNVTDFINVSNNILSENDRNVYDQIAPQIFTTGEIFYKENQTDTSVLGIVNAADNFANTNNVGIRGYSISDPNPNDQINITELFEINSNGEITLTSAGVNSVVNEFFGGNNSFPLNVTVTDAGGITDTESLVMRVTDSEGRALRVDASDFPPGSTIGPFNEPFVFVSDGRNMTIIGSPFSDVYDLRAGGVIVIQGTLQQLNGDRVLGFGNNDKISIAGSIFGVSQLEVTFGSAILDIDSNNDGTSDSTITLEGDYTDALFLVNSDKNSNSTDIRYDILNSRINRFQNKDIPGTYLFAGEEESQNIRANYPQFVEEGYAFKVTTEGNDSLMRLNRFQNKDVPGTYLYAGEEESQNIRANFPQFVEEGIAAYVATPGSSTGESIYRFQNKDVPGTYIFVGEQERDNIIANFPQFTLEGEAFEIVV